MARTKGVTVAVKVPILWNTMTHRRQQRLRQIVGRDTRAIRAFIGVIEHYEKTLLTGPNKNHISDTELDKLTITTAKVDPRYSRRPVVPHDMKARFPRISSSELVECRQTAISMYESYLQVRSKRGVKAVPPTRAGPCRRLPRWIFSQRFKLVQNRTCVARWWLNLRDSLDSASRGHGYHDRLLIPLGVAPFHENQLKRGEVKALQLITNTNRQWWAAFAVRVHLPDKPRNDLPPAVLGIDLGIERAACTVLATPTKVRETRYFGQSHKAETITKYDYLVAEVQKEMDTRRNNGQDWDDLARKLREMRSKREHVAIEYDKVLVRQLIDHIVELSRNYTLYVALGRLKGIRNSAQRGNFKGRKFRGMVHRWAFARIGASLQHGLAQLGWPVNGTNARFRVVPENWTSIMCWKCGSKGKRPKQNYFVCPACGHRTNADRNGAINIAGRLIMLTESVHSVRGLGKWADSVSAGKRSRPKARGRALPGKSLLPSSSVVSHSGESAAVRYVQMDLRVLGDEDGMSDHDPAAVRTVETLSAAGDDTPADRQEKEVRSVGGTKSQ